MIALTAETIRLAARAATKDAAIRAAGELLVESGHIEPGYVDSMLGRERQANTFLGHGIAIPHGMGTDRALINRTGVSVLQLAESVEWGDGQPVRLVVGIAARSDEHIGILAALTDVLDDPATADRLAETGNPAEIVDALSRRAAPAAASSAPATAPHDGAPMVELRIAGEAGLHARPATAFIDIASQFESEVRVEYAGRSANGKALASLLKLGVSGGETIRVYVTGADAAAALAALTAAVEGGLEEEASHAEPDDGGAAWTPVSRGHATAGIPAAPGLAIGRLFQFQATRLTVTDASSGDPATERRAVDAAIETALEQLADVHDAMVARAGKGEAAIFRAHQALLRDDELIADVDRLLHEGHGAAWAWDRVITRREAEIRAVADERLAARGADLHDVGQRVLRVLTGVEHGEPRFPDHPVILLADDLAPSDTARLDPERILGLCTVAGGPTSHTAIIARSVGLPAVVGAGAELLALPDGTMAILDGAAGLLYAEPSGEDLASARAFQAELAVRRDRDARTRYEPAILTDGHRVEVAGNIGRASEAAQAVEAGAEGVGLMRTEFLFLDRDTAPTEDEQFAAYAEMVQALNGLPLILRTLDIGGDKVVPYLALPHEENPFLGVRGVRLCLRQPDLFLPQLRAIYRAAALGPVRIMLPMVSSIEELREVRRIAEAIRVTLGAPVVEIGIMIEVPSAVLMAPELAEEADFFSIGTNDLTQYVLAMDRMHPTLAAHADGLHPAVLRMIDMTVRAAEAAGIWVGVCGGVAGDTTGAVILTGLGVRELSMSLPSVAPVKAVLRRYSSGQTRAFARRALACATAADVRALRLP